jgi:hypothetical protein
LLSCLKTAEMRGLKTWRQQVEAHFGRARGKESNFKLAAAYNNRSTVGRFRRTGIVAWSDHRHRLNPDLAVARTSL